MINIQAQHATSINNYTILGKALYVKQFGPPKPLSFLNSNLPVQTIADTTTELPSILKDLDYIQSPSVHVGNLPSDVTEEQLRKFFNVFGPIVSIRIMGDKTMAIRYAFVEFDSKETADSSLIMSGKLFNGNVIKVAKAKGSLSKGAKIAARQSVMQAKAAIKQKPMEHERTAEVSVVSTNRVLEQVKVCVLERLKKRRGLTVFGKKNYKEIKNFILKIL